MRFLSLSLALVAASLVLLTGTARADETAAPAGDDIVTLKSGGWLRGTIVSSEPGVGVKIITLDKEVHSLPWADVATIEPAKLSGRPGLPLAPAADAPLPVPAAAVPQIVVLAPPAPVGASAAVPVRTLPVPSVVRLHVRTPAPVRILTRNTYFGVVSVGGKLEERSPTVCQAPCDVTLDPEPAQLFRVAEAQGVAESSDVSLAGLKGDVTMAVSPGNATGHVVGAGLLKAAPGLVLAGGLFLGLGAGSNNEGAFVTVGAVTAGIGGAVLIAGLATFFGTRTTVDVSAGRPTAALKPNYWAGEF